MKLSVNNPQIPDFAGMVNTFLKHVEEEMQTQTKAFMESQLAEFKARIEAQDFQSFHAEPLSKRWRAAKRRAGLPLSTMIATGTYLEAIQLTRRATKAGITSYIIQVDPTAKVKDLNGNVRNDITVAEVALINEHGSQRLENRPPARPHWAPFVVAFGVNAADKRKELRDTIVAMWGAAVNSTKPTKSSASKAVSRAVSQVRAARAASAKRLHIKRLVNNARRRANRRRKTL